MRGGYPMLYNFYNHYLNTSMPKTMSRYDAHKRSELRNLCNAIIRLNKESPLYLIDMTDDLQTNVIAIKEHARFLKNAILSIAENEDSTTLKMFNDKILTSSNEDIISVNYIGSEDEIDHAPSFDIDVEQLASNQINKGVYVYNDSSILPSGTYSFNVNISNTNYEFQFLVKDSENNKEILKKVSNMINQADIGIYSSIETNEAGDKQRLSLISTATGTANFSDVIFKISDTNSSCLSGSVSYFGLDQIEQKPNDSKFSINGIPRTSSSNIFTVNKIYELSLHKTTESNESITISFRNDKQSTFNKLTSFVEAYNNMIHIANDSSSAAKKNSKLMVDIGSIAKCYKNELDSMGLIVQKDSSIIIDSDLLSLTINEEEAGDGTFASFRSFRNPLSRKIDYLLLNPMGYVAKTIVTYPNTDDYKYANAYEVSMYSGLMFNNYC